MHCRAADLVATALTAIARRIIFPQCGTFNPYPYMQSPMCALCLVVARSYCESLSLLLLVESRAQCNRLPFNYIAAGGRAAPAGGLALSLDVHLFSANVYVSC